jgi:hypothetical protein
LAACHFAEEFANDRTTAPGVTIDQAHQEGQWNGSVGSA